jgi:hypothetical protein
MNVIKENFSKNSLFKESEWCDGVWFIYAKANKKFALF